MILSQNPSAKHNPNEWTNVIPVASSYDVMTELNSVRMEILDLRYKIQRLDSELEILKQKQQPKLIPLGMDQVEKIMDEAYLAQMKAATTGPRGQQASIWDGIEPHVVRATEKAQGIQPT